jgi:hypothetical protein
LSEIVLPGGLVAEIPPEKLSDPEVQKLLQEVMQTLDENPLQRFMPHAKQVAFMASPAKTKVYMGGTRSGKSTAGVVYVVIQLVDDDMIPPHLTPYKRWSAPVKARVIMPDFGATLMSVMETLKKWVPESQLRGGDWEKAWKEKDHQLHFANGGMIDFLTLEQDVNKFGGVTRQIVLYDEEPKGDKGEEIRWNTSMRLAEVNGEELFAYSPIHGLGWTHDEFEEKKGPEKAPQVWEEPESEDYPNGLIVVRSSIYDNPYLSEEGLKGASPKSRRPSGPPTPRGTTRTSRAGLSGILGGDPRGGRIEDRHGPHPPSPSGGRRSTPASRPPPSSSRVSTRKADWGSTTSTKPPASRRSRRTAPNGSSTSANTGGSRRSRSTG